MLFLLSARLFFAGDALSTPADRFGAERLFHIELGESVGQISANLEAHGLIGDAASFQAYLQYAGLDTSIQAGDYLLSAAHTPVEIAHALQDPTPGDVAFGVLAGWRMEEIAASLPTSGLNISEEAFLLEAQKHPQGVDFAFEIPANATAEGFLAPGTYQLPRGLSAEGLVSALLSQFSLPADVGQGFAAQGVNLYEGVILASIIEREAIVDDEMPQIAAVFYNRLAIGMKLDTDPSVQYAVGFNTAQNTWWTTPLSRADLQVDSPYNTYLYPGLPPGPICSPSEAALRAAAFPVQTPYYYFRAACDGSRRHIFAVTYEEHLANACP
jgi:UPF0755 protein